MRHQPYPIDPAARDRWFAHMRAALAASGLPAEVEEVVLDYFERASQAMINQPRCTDLRQCLTLPVRSAGLAA